MLSSLLLAWSVAWASPGPSVLEEGSHCVAYKVTKTMFLVRSDEVIGKNCDVSAQVLPEVGGLYHVEVNIPVRSFNSGDSERDKDVFVILKADQRAELTFRSKAYTEEKWHEMFRKSTFPLEGELFIGTKSFPLTLQVTYSEKENTAEVAGIGKVRFKDFDMKPPKVAGGVVAKASSELELHFHLVSQRILGADSIRLGGAKEKPQ